jgi:hypothetical protein
MDRQKLKRLGDDIIKAGCTAYLWYQEKTAPKTYGPYLTYDQYRELKKRPWRKRWDAFYYRHMGWMYRRQDESLGQYFKRGYPAWLFLGHRMLQQPKPPKGAIILPVLTALYFLAFPFFTSSAVPGWEYTSPIRQLVGDDNFNLVVSLYILSGMIVFAIGVGLAIPVIMKECRDELRAGKTVWQVFSPDPWLIALATWPISLPIYCIRRAYRYDRRFVLFPVMALVKSFNYISPKLQTFAVRYRKRSREQA